MLLKSLYGIEHFDHSLRLIWAVSFKNFLKHKWWNLYSRIHARN